ncbi:DMT family transporter, partial [Selenomonadales bacterium OttesenSCG-928-I06]|nr:DMT family transporter [Selenomonadales bacterium OttesenSCG-928-I06]
MGDNAKGYTAALLYSVIIGLSFMYVKIALQYSSSLDLLAHRFTLAFICIATPVLIGKIKLNVSAKNVLKLLPLAFFFPISFFLFQTFGLKLIPSSEAGIIQATTPVFTIIFAILILQEKINYKQGFSVFLSVGGVIFISLINGTSIADFSVWGTIFILGSTMASAIYSVLTRKHVSNYSLYDFTFVMTSLGFVTFNIAAIIEHLVLGTWSISGFYAPFAEKSFVIAVIYLGIPSSFLTGFLVNYSLKKIEASKMSIFNNLAVVIAMVAGAVFLGETIFWYHIVGAAMIIAG